MRAVPNTPKPDKISTPKLVLPHLIIVCSKRGKNDAIAANGNINTKMMKKKSIKNEKIEKNNRPTMSEIVASSNAIKYSLNQLASDVLYKTRIVAEEKESILNKENLKSKENFEYEY